MKEYKRSIDRSVREMDREIFRLEQQQKKLVVEIKKCAKENQQMVSSHSDSPFCCNVLE